MEQISVIKFPWLCPLQLTPLYLWLLSQALPAARLLTQTFFHTFPPSTSCFSCLFQTFSDFTTNSAPAFGIHVDKTLQGKFLPARAALGTCSCSSGSELSPAPTWVTARSRGGSQTFPALHASQNTSSDPCTALPQASASGMEVKCKWWRSRCLEWCHIPAVPECTSKNLHNSHFIPGNEFPTLLIQGDPQGSCLCVLSGRNAAYSNSNLPPE